MKRVPSSKVYRLLYPAVPAVVAALHGGRASAMPVVSVVSLSNRPAMVGFSSSRDHDTYSAVVKARCFSVSWLDKRHSAAVEALGSTSGRERGDKLRASGLHYTARGSPPIPVITEASAYLTCSLVEVRRTGDHDLLVAGVKTARAIEDFGDYWAFKGYRPFLYSGRGRGY